MRPPPSRDVVAPGAARDVVVVGSDTFGLCLSLGLARAGYSISVLSTPASAVEGGGGAPLVWPGTQEALATLDVLSRFESCATALDRLHVFDADRGRPFMELPLGALQEVTPYPRLLVTRECDGDRILHDALRKHPNVHLRPRVRVTGVEDLRSGGGARAVFELGGRSGSLGGRFVVVCDRSYRSVRGPASRAPWRPLRMARLALVDVRVSKLGLASPRISTARGLVVGFAMEPGLWRLATPLAPVYGSIPDRRVVAATRALLGDKPAEIVWRGVVSCDRGAGPVVQGSHVVHAGAAADAMGTLGGLGFNASVHEAVALCAALVDALANDSELALHGYAKGRRRALEYRSSTVMDVVTGALLSSPGFWPRGAMRAAALGLRMRPLRLRLQRRLAMIERGRPR